MFFTNVSNLKSGRSLLIIDSNLLLKYKGATKVIYTIIPAWELRKYFYFGAQQILFKFG